MKIGRNDPCPCGSGKKYKRCCASKDQSTANENNDEDENLIDRVSLLEGLNRFRNYLLKKKPHIQEYKKLRKLHCEIGDSMMRYYEEGRFEQKFNTGNASAITEHPTDNTFILLESKFDMETQEGLHAFQDMLMYKPAPNANCLTEEFLRIRRYRLPEKIEFLQSMLDSRLGLFEVTEVDSEEGYAYIKEVFTGSEYRITDIGMSGNAGYDDFYYYLRIISCRGINFSAGLCLLFEKTDPFILEFIERQRKKYSPNGDLLRFTELYNRYSKDSKGLKLVRNTFK